MTRKLLILIVIVILASTLTARSQTSRIRNPDRIHWQQLNPDGSKYAVLEGDRTKPGPFTYTFFLPSGIWVGPHTHTGDVRVFVLSGTLLLGDGRRFDKPHARRIPTGSFFFVAHDAPHWEGAGGDNLILILGIGAGRRRLSRHPKRSGSYPSFGSIASSHCLPQPLNWLAIRTTR